MVGGRQAVIGIDIGGTKLLVALISAEGRVIDRELAPTRAADQPDAVIEQLAELTERVVARHRNEGVGKPFAASMAVAGAIDTKRGIVTVSPNLAQWKDVPLRDLVQASLKVRTFMINDASAAALGEHVYGPGKGTANMVFLTVSTGIGGGIIVDGKLYQGTNGAAGEIGHMVIEVDGPACGCGNNGCLEALASGTAIARYANERISIGTSTAIPKFAGDGKPVTAEAVANAAKQGDPLANEIVAKAARYLGIGLTNVINIFNPDRVVIGGGVANMGEMLLRPARAVVKERAFKISADAATIVRGTLGADAGIIGAARFAFDESDKGMGS